MRLATFSKVMMIVAIAVCAGWLTSAVVGQTRSQRKKAAAREAPPQANRTLPGSDSGPISIAGPARRLEPGEVPAAHDDTEPISPALRSSSATDSVRVTTDGQKVNVQIQAKLMDTIPTMSYLWSLRVYAGSTMDKLLSERYYKDQLFKIPLKQFVHSTFSESFTLEPGAYMVQICLHRLRDGYDLSNLADKQAWERALVLGPVQSITVAPIAD